jgi:hypothetical protein
MSKYSSPSYAWQVLRGQPEWWFQTDRPEIKEKMSRRKGFREITIWSNPPLWIFEKGFTRPTSATRCMESLTGLTAAWNENKALFYADKERSEAKAGSSLAPLLNGKKTSREIEKTPQSCTPPVGKNKVCNCKEACTACACKKEGLK